MSESELSNEVLAELKESNGNPSLLLGLLHSAFQYMQNPKARNKLHNIMHSSYLYIHKSPFKVFAGENNCTEKYCALPILS